MLIPSITDSWLAASLYLIELFIIYKGVTQYLQLRKNPESRIRSLVPLGAIGTILGIIGYIRGYMMTFDAIEAANDISPAIVANAFGNSGGYPILGLVTLATAFLFKYVNQSSHD